YHLGILAGLPKVPGAAGCVFHEQKENESSWSKTANHQQDHKHLAYPMQSKALFRVYFLPHHGGVAHRRSSAPSKQGSNSLEWDVRLSERAGPDPGQRGRSANEQRQTMKYRIVTQQDRQECV